jgi:dTDP-4-dehydrorhamnose reductase
MFLTGGTGLLGRHLQRSPGMERWELVAPGSYALDVRRREPVLDMITSWKPAAVVHLAYRMGDRRAIVDGSRNVAEAAALCGARLVHMSTDVVFAGRPAPYTEADRPFAVTDYGAMKAEAEAIVAAAHPHPLIARTSLMYATDFLAPLQLDVERAARGESSMAFFTDEYRCPAHAADIAAAIARLAAMPEITGPLHIAGPQAVSRAELAIAVAKWMGLNPARLRTTTIAESGLVRVGHLVLDSSKADALGFHVRPLAEALR